MPTMLVETSAMEHQHLWRLGAMMYNHNASWLQFGARQSDFQQWREKIACEVPGPAGEPCPGLRHTPEAK